MNQEIKRPFRRSTPYTRNKTVVVTFENQRTQAPLSKKIIVPRSTPHPTTYHFLATIFAGEHFMIRNPETRARLQAAKGKKGLISKRDPARSGPPIIANDSTDDILPSTSPLLSGPPIPAARLVITTRNSEWLKT